MKVRVQTLVPYACVATAIVLAAVVVTGQQQFAPKANQPGLVWSDAELKRAAYRIRAGRVLTPKRWPNGARVAVALSFNPDAFAPVVNSGNTNPVDLSRGEYFIRTGVPRVQRFLDKHNIPVTWFIPGATAMIYPELVASIKRRPQDEVGLHGWTHEDPRALGEAEERRMIGQSSDLLTKLWGRRPAGNRSPGLQVSALTLPLLKKAGVFYDTTLQAMDQPYEVVIDGVPSGIVELPPNWVLDDTAFILPTGALPSPRLVTQVFKDDFDRAYREGTTFVLIMHPDGMGQRSRIPHLEDLINHMKSKPGVWFATGEQIARYVAEQAGLKVPSPDAATH